MSRINYRTLPVEGTRDARLVARVVNELLKGRLNIGQELTVLSSESFPYTVSNPVVGAQSVVLLQAENQDALEANFRVDNITSGSFDLTPDTGAGAWTSASLRYVVLG